MDFPVVMYGCESWTIKKAEHWRIDAFELWCWRRLLTVPWTASPRRSSQSKEIQLIHHKGDESWVFIGRTDIEAETPILWPPDAKNWLIWTDPDAGKDCGQEEKGMTEDKMVGWYHQLNEREFGWTLWVGDGQGGLACWSSWGRKELDMTEWLNGTELHFQNLILLSFNPFILRMIIHGNINFIWQTIILSTCNGLAISINCGQGGSVMSTKRSGK